MHAGLRAHLSLCYLDLDIWWLRAYRPREDALADWQQGLYHYIRATRRNVAWHLKSGQATIVHVGLYPECLGGAGARDIVQYNVLGSRHGGQ